MCLVDFLGLDLNFSWHFSLACSLARTRLEESALTGLLTRDQYGIIRVRTLPNCDILEPRGVRGRGLERKKDEEEGLVGEDGE